MISNTEGGGRNGGCECEGMADYIEKDREGNN